MRGAWLAVAALFLMLFVALGFEVTRHGEPLVLLSLEHSLVDRSSLTAWWLTWACYVYVLVPVTAALLVAAWQLPAWRARILFSVAMLLICWQAADLFQHVFARPRRLDWVVKHETAFSYPSSHAAIATGFYALWAVIIWASELRRATRIVAVLLLLAIAVGTCWSRLALGAHYLTDLVGGILLGAGLVSAGLALVPVKVFGRPAGRL